MKKIRPDFMIFEFVGTLDETTIMFIFNALLNSRAINVARYYNFATYSKNSFQTEPVLETKFQFLILPDKQCNC